MASAIRVWNTRHETQQKMRALIVTVEYTVLRVLFVTMYALIFCDVEYFEICSAFSMLEYETIKILDYKLNQSLQVYLQTIHL